MIQCDDTDEGCKVGVKAGQLKLDCTEVLTLGSKMNITAEHRVMAIISA